MAKKKIKIIKRKFREIKKLSPREIKQEPKEEEEEQESEEREKESKEEFAFDDFEEAERRAPLLASREIEKPEELESKLEGFRGKEGKGEEDEEKGEFKYDFEKPKYSFSESEEMIDREQDISELISQLRKKDVIREAPRILTEKEEDTVSIVTPSEFRGGEVEEYITKYVEPHEKDENISMHEDKKRDIKKYKRVL